MKGFCCSHTLRFLALSMVAALPCYPQVAASFAQLNGSVRDASGGVVVNAAVTLRETETNRRYETQSGAGGRYLSTNLPSGVYELSVAAQGFATSTRLGIAL